MKISTGLCLKLGLTETTELKKKKKMLRKKQVKMGMQQRKSATMYKQLKEWGGEQIKKREMTKFWKAVS